MGKYIFILFGCMAFSMQLFAQSDQAIIRAAQTGKEGASTEELVSFKSDLPYSRAMQALSELSKKMTGKIIIDHSPMRDKETGIGINIESMYWKDAFELILRTNQLWYNDNPEYMEVISLADLNKPSAGDLSVNNLNNQDNKKSPAGGSAAFDSASACPDILSCRSRFGSNYKPTTRGHNLLGFL